jgi:hypothetical protein
MARIKIVELDKIKEASIDSTYIGFIYLVQYPTASQTQLNFICFSLKELYRELKKNQTKIVPTVYELINYGTPKLKKIPTKQIKDLLND